MFIYNTTTTQEANEGLAGIYSIVGILAAIIVGLLVWLIVIKVKKMKKNKKGDSSNPCFNDLDNQQINQLKRLMAENETKQQELDRLIKDYMFKLETIGSIDHLQAKEIYLNELYLQNKKSLIEKYNEYEKELKENYQAKANNLIISILERNAEEIVIDRSSSFLKVDDDMKARIIGKEGRNKKTFEQLTGVDLIIEKDNPLVTLSSTNLARREIARLSLLKIMESKSIEPCRIESIYHQIKEEFELELYNIGKDAIEEKLGVYDLNDSIYSYVGLLKYRTSYGQNILQHALECANFAYHIGQELEVDSNKAKLAAFFHDLGKCMDLDMNMDHVQAGMEIAKKCDLPEYIIHAIETHHSTNPPYDVYGAITKIADTLSSSRPGARIESYEEFIQRVNQIERICLEFPEVSTAYAIKSGRHVRVIVKPLAVRDNELSFLAARIKHRFEADDLLKKFKIEITLIKENKYSFSTDIQY